MTTPLKFLLLLITLFLISSNFVFTQEESADSTIDIIEEEVPDSSFGFAKQEPLDVIYLKNGQIIKGNILEKIPKKSIKIKMEDGEIVEFDMKAVKKIKVVKGKLKDKKAVSPDLQSKKTEDATKNTLNAEQAVEKQNGYSDSFKDGKNIKKSKNDESESIDSKGRKSKKRGAFVICFSPYISAGYLISAPTWEDLNFNDYWTEPVFQDHVNDAEMSLTNYSFGFLLLTPIVKNSLNVGLDFGFCKIFSYSIYQKWVRTFNLTETWDGYENALRVLGMIEYTLADRLIAFQLGLGFVDVFWYDKHTVKPTRYDPVTETSGSAIKFAFNLGGGINIPLSRKIEIPLKIRMDFIKRYGMLVNIGLYTGINFLF